jgi:heme exporter protein B
VNVFVVVFKRDLRLAFRRFSEMLNPLLFFAVVTSLFPLAVSAGVEELRLLGVGVLWVAALLSSLLALDGLFRNDADDGSLEQLLLGPSPLGLIALAKVAAHWVVAGLPLAVLVPIVSLSFYLPASAFVTLACALALATPTISVLVAIGAALTISLKSGGSIIGLLVLPLLSPLLIFGAHATDLAVQGEPATGFLYLLASMAVLAVSLGPLAIAAALRVSME